MAVRFFGPALRWREGAGVPEGLCPLRVQKLWGRRQRSGTVVVVRKPMEVPP